MTRVFKFGGALMKDADGIRRVASLTARYQHEPLVVVVSALGKTTNALELLVKYSIAKDFSALEKEFVRMRIYHFEIAEALFENARHTIFDDLNSLFTSLLTDLKADYPDRYFAYDQIVCYGEQLSSVIVNAFLQANKQPGHLVDARTLIVTNQNYTSAKVDWEYSRKTVETRLRPILDAGEIVLTQGFVGANHLGNYTTLGREGSDFTAAVLANILDADEVSIWKDVPGLMNADPKRFDDCIKLDNISYYEAIELAFYGASVVHPKTIQPVQRKNIPLFVRSFYQPDDLPSQITNDPSNDQLIHKIIVKDKQVLLSIGARDLSFIAEENLTRIFDAFSKHKIHINLMQNAAVSFSVCFNEDEIKLQALVEELKEEFVLKYNTNLQLITVRHYNDELIAELTTYKNIYLEQKSRSTIQLLVRG